MTSASGTGKPGYVTMPGSMTWLISTKRGGVRDMNVSLQAAADMPINNERRVMPTMTDNLVRRRGKKRGNFT